MACRVCLIKKFFSKILLKMELYLLALLLMQVFLHLFQKMILLKLVKKVL